MRCQEVRLASYVVVASVALNAVTVAQEKLPPLQSEPSSGDVVYPIGKHGDPILLPVTTSGTKGTFLLDSGASFHVLDKHYKPELGKAVASRSVGTLGSSITVEFFRPPDMFMGMLALKRERPVVQLDLTGFSETLGQELHGFLGAPFFRERLIQLDFDRGRVRILKTGGPPLKSWGVPLSLRADSNGMSYIKNVKIGEDKAPFILDTGMSAPVSLEKGFFERLKLQGLVSSVRTEHATTGSGDVARQSGRLRSIRLGPFEHESIMVNESNENRIGLGYLARFQATIDVSGERLYLTGGDSYAKTDDVDCSGLHFKRKNDRIVVDIIDKNSPADRAGITSDDVLLEINGKPAAVLNLNQLRRDLRGNAGVEFRMTILRGARQIPTRFILRDYADWKNNHLENRD